MRFNSNKIITDLKLKPFGAKGWLSNPNINCPECGKSDKFGINVTDTSGAVHCFKCDFSQNLVRFLKSINRGDLVEFEYINSLNTKIKGFEKEDLVEEVKEKKCELPRGFRELNYSKYLELRGFKEHQYEKYGVGMTNHFLEKRLHGYLIFQIFNKGQLKGWLARSKRSKEWHKQNLKDYKEGIGQLSLRYRNSTGTDFSKLLGNYDDITKNTHTVILVEGLFDAANIENLMRLHNGESIKCCYTFGNKISSEQIKLLREKGSVKNTIFMYDPGTEKQVQQYSMTMSKYFNVQIVEIKDESVDPGDILAEYLAEILQNVQNNLYFYTKITSKI